MIGKLVKTFKNAESSTSPCQDSVLRSLDWYLVPLLNPDGYEFSHSQDRLWRKNRRAPGQGEKCPGVDLNRNFHLGYGLGASTDPCSEVFQGPGPGSEPETKALQSLGEMLNTSLLYYVSLHAYGQSWLTPWGYKTEPPPHQEELEAVARAAINQMECSYGAGSVPAREYEVGAAGDIYYIAGGASDDWFYARLVAPPRHSLTVLTACFTRTSAKFSFTIELPDDGREFGFLFPAELAPQVSASTRDKKKMIFKK